MSDPVFKDIPNFEGVYQISTTGVVKSLSRIIPRYPSPYVCKEKIIKPNINRKGYQYCNLYVNSKPSCREIHTLVALTFLGPRPKNMDIRHIDGDPLNNDVENLCYGSRQQNIQDSKLHGTFPIGEKRKKSKLTKEAVIDIRTSEETIESLSKKYGVKEVTISHARSGMTWAHIDIEIPAKRIARNEKNGNSRLTNEQVKEILASSARYAEIAKKFDVSYSMIEKIKRNKFWTNLNSDERSNKYNLLSDENILSIRNSKLPNSLLARIYKVKENTIIYVKSKRKKLKS